MSHLGRCIGVQPFVVRLGHVDSLELKMKVELKLDEN